MMIRRRNLNPQMIGKRSEFINPPRMPNPSAPFADFYRSKEWREFRALVIKERGHICQDKEHPAGAPMDNIDLDHIKELVDGGAKLSRSNVLLRCRSCHGRKTALQKRQRNEREFWLRKARLTGGS